MRRGNRLFPLWAAGAALLLILVVGCRPSGAVDGTALPPSATATLASAGDTQLSPVTAPAATTEGPGPAPSPVPAVTRIVTGPSPPASQEVVLLAKEDLAQRLNVAPEAIVVSSVEPVTWPDTSLGCPQPGMMYAQVLTPGFWVILEADGQAYEYHTDLAQTAIRCTEENATRGSMPLSGTVEPGLATLVEMAREDLAQRLSVPIDQIQVLEAKSVVWPDASLGCPKPGMSYIQVLQEGALIRLQVGPFQYEYHAGGSQSPFLCDQASPGPKTTEPADIDPLPLNPPND